MRDDSGSGRIRRASRCRRPSHGLRRHDRERPARRRDLLRVRRAARHRARLRPQRDRRRGRRGGTRARPARRRARLHDPRLRHPRRGGRWGQDPHARRRGVRRAGRLPDGPPRPRRARPDAMPRDLAFRRAFLGQGGARFGIPRARRQRGRRRHDRPGRRGAAAPARQGRGPGPRDRHERRRGAEYRSGAHRGEVLRALRDARRPRRMGAPRPALLRGRSPGDRLFGRVRHALPVLLGVPSRRGDGGALPGQRRVARAHLPATARAPAHGVDRHGEHLARHPGDPPDPRHRVRTRRQPPAGVRGALRDPRGQQGRRRRRCGDGVDRDRPRPRRDRTGAAAAGRAREGPDRVGSARRDGGTGRAAADGQ